MVDAKDSQRTYARFAGLMFLVALATHMAGLVLVSVVEGSGTFDERSQRNVASEGLYRLGLVFSLSGALSTILLATALYAAIKPIDGNLGMIALLFRTGETVVGATGVVTAFTVLEMSLVVRDAAGLDGNQLGALASLFAAWPSAEVAAIFFSLGSTVFFYVFLRSPYIPKALSAFGLVASLCYAALWFSRLLLPDSTGLIVLGSLPILVAEVATGLWLLIKGIKAEPAT